MKMYYFEYSRYRNVLVTKEFEVEEKPRTYRNLSNNGIIKKGDIDVLKTDSFDYSMHSFDPTKIKDFYEAVLNQLEKELQALRAKEVEKINFINVIRQEYKTKFGD